MRPGSSAFRVFGGEENGGDFLVRRRLVDVCVRLEKPALAEMWLRAAKACPQTPELGQKQ